MTHSLRFIASMLVLAVAGFANATDVTDELTYTALGLNSTTSYQDFSGKTVTSSAVYAGNASSGGGKFIQLRSTSNSGIIATTSGGTIKSITVTFNSTTLDARQLDAYGSTSAYSSAADLYSPTTQGTLIGSAIYSKTGEATVTITPTGTYTYIGLRSNASAMYIDKIDIVWNSDASNVVAHLKLQVRILL
jgi:hypothetical protein